MNITTFTELTARLRDAKTRRGELKRIAIGAGVPYSTVHRIASDEPGSPRIDAVERLMNYLSRQRAA